MPPLQVVGDVGVDVVAAIGVSVAAGVTAGVTAVVAVGVAYSVVADVGVGVGTPIWVRWLGDVTRFQHMVHPVVIVSVSGICFSSVSFSSSFYYFTEREDNIFEMWRILDIWIINMSYK